jgi:hypothetical protein
MASIGIIRRGKYGERLVETIRAHSSLDVRVTDIPVSLPEFIDEPEEFLASLDLDESVFDAEILITYSLHPDLTPAIVRRAAQGGAKSVIIPGGPGKAPLDELMRVAIEYEIHIDVDEICCAIGEHSSNLPFTAGFGTPELEVSVSEGKIDRVHVLKGAPCGSTWYMAAGIAGTPVAEAPAKAGLLIQQYPCRAVRGGEGGIHRSAELHKNAMEEALRNVGFLEYEEWENKIREKSENI